MKSDCAAYGSAWGRARLSSPTCEPVGFPVGNMRLGSSPTIGLSEGIGNVRFELAEVKREQECSPRVVVVRYK